MWSGGMVHSQNSHGSREYSVKLRAYFARPGERLLHRKPTPRNFRRASFTASSEVRGSGHVTRVAVSISAGYPKQMNSESGCCNALAPSVALHMRDSQYGSYGISDRIVGLLGLRAGEPHNLGPLFGFGCNMRLELSRCEGHGLSGRFD